MIDLRQAIRDLQFDKTPDDWLLDHLRQPQHRTWFADANREHYQLLAWVSRSLSGSTLFDIGTFRGLSALALSANPANRVVSYDIENFLDLKDPPSNIEFKIGDFFKDTEILACPFIMFDVDPHNGEIERKTVAWLEANQYRGIVLFDDIHLNDHMRSLWNSIQQEKHDLTAHGHWSGTGAVFF